MRRHPHVARAAATGRAGSDLPDLPDLPGRRAPRSRSDPAAALQDLLDAGVITQEEFDGLAERLDR